MRVIATAGHVDHGKSTLVRALTGVDPDRLAEEKARGLTIDLGFAATVLPSGEEVGFVDVPGHHRYVPNMLAGVGAVDACVLVVAANEGWKPQSEEHLRILELLGVGHGLVALTKVDGLDGDDRELAVMELRDRLAGTFLASADVVEVDAPAGVGMEALRAALDRLAAATPAAADRGRPRLWVDRSFSRPGAGTVVTGTLTGGAVALGDELAVLPGSRRGRVRGLQTHHHPLEVATPGRRLAVNLAGLGHDQARRGDAAVRPGQWHQASVLDAELRVLAGLDHAVSRRGAYVAYLGTAEVPVRLRLLGRVDEIPPGDKGLVRLWLAGGMRLPLVPGDRYVLRESGRAETVGGGEVLDVAPMLPAGRAAPSRSVTRVVGERGWVDAAELDRLTGERIPPTLGRWVVAPNALWAAVQAIRGACASAGSAGVDLAALDDRRRAVVAAGIEGIEVADGRVYQEGLAPRGLSEGAQRVLAALERGAFAPPDIPQSDRAALRELQRTGQAVEAGDVWFASKAVNDAAAMAARLLAAHPEGFTVGQARDALGITRKHALPLLGCLDRAGITRRTGDLRVAGPRLPPP